MAPSKIKTVRKMTEVVTMLILYLVRFYIYVLHMWSYIHNRGQHSAIAGHNKKKIKKTDSCHQDQYEATVADYLYDLPSSLQNNKYVAAQSIYQSSKL